MRGHAQSDIDKRTRDFAEARREIQGRLPKGPFEFSKDLTFDDIQPTEEDTPVAARFKRAVRRDSRYSTATGPYLMVFGFSQNLRSIYDGGRQLIDGGQ